MNYLLILFISIFGAIIGSFLNVVVIRYGSKFLIKSRSKCFSCGYLLKFQDLVPILSFLSIRGRCRYCRSRISIQYPLVEFFTALIFLLIYLRSGLNIETIFYWIVWSIFVVIFVYDIKHKIIPDGMVYSLIFLGALRVVVFFVTNPVEFVKLLFLPDIGLGALLVILSGPILFFPFAFLWFISQGKWMGFGDAKLALALGWLFGFVGGLSAVIFGFWLGSIVGLGLIFLSKINISYLSWKFKNLTIKSEIPFAPFLILGAAIVFFLNINILSLFNII